MESTSPGGVRLPIVVDLLDHRTMLSGNTGMTNIGQVDLPTSPALVPAQYCAAIDPTTGFGYLGSAHGANPGIVSKINLNGPARDACTQACRRYFVDKSNRLGPSAASKKFSLRKNVYTKEAKGVSIAIVIG